MEANYNDILFALLVATITLVACWESLWPRRTVSAGTVARWPHNISLGLLNQVVVYWLDVGTRLATAWYVLQLGGGLFGHFGVGIVGQLLISFLAFELLSYGLHRLMHTNRWLWRMHTVHHSDTELDFSSTYRNHPFETVISVLASVPVVILLGPAPVVILIYELGRVGSNIFAHGNIYLPEAIDRRLRRVLVTPDYHRLHHHTDPAYTNSNYATFLPIYDYLFGTATHVPFNQQEQVPVGLEYFRKPGDSYFHQLLAMPFRRR